MLVDRSANPVLIPPSGQLTRLQYFVTVCNRLKNTVACLLLYLVLILLNVVVIAWEYSGGSTRHWLAICLEAVINVILACEVATSILHLRRQYWHHWINIVDFTLTVLCLLFFIIFLTHPPPDSSRGADDTWETLDVAVLIVRYCFQLTRISVLIYRGRRTTDVLVQDDVDFTVHEMRDKMDKELAKADTKQNGSGGGGAAAKKKASVTGSVAVDVDKQLEKQKLLDRGSSRGSMSDSTDQDSSQPLHEDERTRQQRSMHDRALAGIEMELKRGAEHSDDESRSRRSGQPVKRSVSPSVGARSKVGQLPTVSRARPLAVGASDNGLHRTRSEHDEDDTLDLSSSDEDELV